MNLIAKSSSALVRPCGPVRPSLHLSKSHAGICRSRHGALPMPTMVPQTNGAMASRRAIRLVPRAGEDKPVSTKNTQFGYSRKDILLIGVGLFALGYALYYGLQAAGMEAGMAGNYVQLIIFMGICVGWVSTYVYRVATKQMTYVKQLEQYEDAVMRKRVEEMTEEEMTELVNEAEADKGRGRPGR